MKPLCVYCAASQCRLDYFCVNLDEINLSSFAAWVVTLRKFEHTFWRLRTLSTYHMKWPRTCLGIVRPLVVTVYQVREWDGICWRIHAIPVPCIKPGIYGVKINKPPAPKRFLTIQEGRSSILTYIEDASEKNTNQSSQVLTATQSYVRWNRRLLARDTKHNRSAY